MAGAEKTKATTENHRRLSIKTSANNELCSNMLTSVLMAIEKTLLKYTSALGLAMLVKKPCNKSIE